MDKKVRSVSEVLSSLYELTGHAWIVMDTGGGCEVFFSEDMNAVLGLDATINYDSSVGVFDSVADHMNWDFRYEIAEGLEDPFTVDSLNDSQWQLTIVDHGVNIWEHDEVTYSAFTLTEILNYLNGRG
jgi:hypothetical protein